jgi:hypothetical protein
MHEDPTVTDSASAAGDLWRSSRGGYGSARGSNAPSAQPVRIAADLLDRVLAVSFKHPHCPACADAMAMQEDHNVADILCNQNGWTAFVQPRSVILSAVRMTNKSVASPEHENLVVKRLSLGANENCLTKGRRSFIVRDTLNNMSGSYNRPRKACNQEPGNRSPAGHHKLFRPVSRCGEAFSGARQCLNHPNR